jgi:hypothetical protein
LCDGFLGIHGGARSLRAAKKDAGEAKGQGKGEEAAVHKQLLSVGRSGLMTTPARVLC